MQKDYQPLDSIHSLSERHASPVTHVTSSARRTIPPMLNSRELWFSFHGFQSYEFTDFIFDTLNFNIYISKKQFFFFIFICTFFTSLFQISFDTVHPRPRDASQILSSLFISIMFFVYPIFRAGPLNFTLFQNSHVKI